MSKSKTHRSELEFLRQRIKKLESIIRGLKKEVTKTRKSNKNVDELIDTFVESTLEEEFYSRNQCKECYKGLLQNSPIGNKRLIITCTQCTFRDIIKK